MHSRFSPTAALTLTVGLLAVTAPVFSQAHEGDFWIGRSASGQLRLGGLALGEGGFNPLRDTVNLVAVGATFRATDPGFDANVSAVPAADFFPLQSGASIRLIGVGRPDGPVSADFGSACIGDCRPPFPAETGSVPLGGATLHRHIRFSVHTAGAQPYDPLRLTWNATYRLVDDGTTRYSPSEPFTVYFATVACRRGDVNGDARVDFNDIDGFVAVLVDPAGAVPVARCAADTDRDGYVTFNDIDSFVAALVGG